MLPFTRLSYIVESERIPLAGAEAITIAYRSLILLASRLCTKEIIRKR